MKILTRNLETPEKQESENECAKSLLLVAGKDADRILRQLWRHDAFPQVLCFS